ncbi:unnamed protein product [Pedinophyceae sp. YPF-701]|nr:unnamed protein product [Pedinophyceae sp. YPF-701]
MSYVVYPVANYKFGTKDAKEEKPGGPDARWQRRREAYETSGVRRTVKAVVLVHVHSHPHVLVLVDQRGIADLPGGRLKPDEPETDGLCRKLDRQMGPKESDLAVKWEVAECLGTFWRPNFDPVLYPYLPPHVTRPKESVRVFFVGIPDQCRFQVPKNYTLKAVPLFQLYDNGHKYGPLLGAVPVLLSRLYLQADEQAIKTED